MPALELCSNGDFEYRNDRLGSAKGASDAVGAFGHPLPLLLPVFSVSAAPSGEHSNRIRENNSLLKHTWAIELRTEKTWENLGRQ